MTVCPLQSQTQKSRPQQSQVQPSQPQLSRPDLPHWQTATSIAIIGTIAFGLWSLQQQWDIDLFSSDGFATAIHHLGPWGPLLYMLLIVISVVVSQIPGAGLAIAAGAIWGPFIAGIYTVLGGFLGAVIAYSLGRAVGPSLLKAITGKTITFSQARGEWHLGGLIFVMRLLPVFSFDLISYGAGITKLSLPIYATATLLGMIPSTFLLTYLGGAFHLGAIATTSIMGLFVAGLIVLPWGVRRHNWFDLQNVVQID